MMFIQNTEEIGEMCIWLALINSVASYSRERGKNQLPDIYICIYSQETFRFRFTIACENICFSSLFAAGDVSRGGTSATQRQKFHTDDANQCLHNKSSSHGVPNTNLSNFTCLLVDFVKCCVHLPTSSSKTQTLLLEKSIFHCFARDSSRLHLTLAAFCLLSVIRKQ